MNWTKENKFLAGYGVVMLIGIGALGYKLYSANSAFGEANARYTTKASSYNNLRRLAPYPNRQHLAAFEAQKKEAADVITAFQAGLAKREFSIEQMSPERFQDVLKKATTDIRARAAAANVVLATKDKFYLGFSRYETAPPDKDATALLARDLKAIEWVVDQLISTPIMELRGLNRPEIPEEKGKSSATPRPPAAMGGNKPGLPGKNVPDLVNVHTFDIVIFCKQHQLAKLLNTIISPSAPQFYIPRNIRIVNSNTKPPSRADSNPAAGVPPVVNATGGKAPAVAPIVDVPYIVGEESLEATIRLEIVDFTEPETAAAAATPAG